MLGQQPRLTLLCYQEPSCQRAPWLWEYIGHLTPLALGLLYHFSWLSSFDLMFAGTSFPLGSQSNSFRVDSPDSSFAELFRGHKPCFGCSP